MRKLITLWLVSALAIGRTALVGSPIREAGRVARTNGVRATHLPARDIGQEKPDGERFFVQLNSQGGRVYA